VGVVTLRGSVTHGGAQGMPAAAGDARLPAHEADRRRVLDVVLRTGGGPQPTFGRPA
jgi:hypothetical protein